VDAPNENSSASDEEMIVSKGSVSDSQSNSQGLEESNSDHLSHEGDSQSLMQ